VLEVFVFAVLRALRVFVVIFKVFKQTGFLAAILAWRESFAYTAYVKREALKFKAQYGILPHYFNNWD